MVRTPTYYVFHQFMHHQDAELLDSVLTGCGEIGSGETSVPEVTESVSKDKDGFVTITLGNLSASDFKSLDVVFSSGSFKVDSASVVTQDIHAHNTFDNPDTVTEKCFDGFSEQEKDITVTLPPASVVLLRLKMA